MVKTIILDIDGVLISYLDLKEKSSGGIANFKSAAVESFNAIVKHYCPDTLIMTAAINSRFRGPVSITEYRNFLKDRGLIIPKTFIIGDQVNRYSYVEKLIHDGLEDYLIIDDEAGGYYTSGFTETKRILQPNRYRCLDQYDVMTVTKTWQL